MTTSHIDLHTHSSFSDGMLSPSEIVARARQLQLAVIALTDHDTTAGIPEFLTFKEAGDIEIVPGIELSAHHELAPVHILGYGIKHDSQQLQNNLIEIPAMIYHEVHALTDCILIEFNDKKDDFKNETVKFK